MKEIFKSKIYRKFVIPFLLLLFWFVFTIIYILNYNLSLSVTSFNHTKKNFVNYTTDRLLKGNKLIGQFTGQENYLGIVTVSFTTFNRVEYSGQDVLVFRIKEKNAKKWYYQNNYRVGPVYDTPFFPFGFPKIKDSKGKDYVFEIQSLNGNNENSVALKSWEPVLLTRYQLPKQDLISSKRKLINFFAEKIWISAHSNDVIFYSFVYLLPFIFYLLIFLSPLRKIILPKVSRGKLFIIDLLRSNPLTGRLFLQFTQLNKSFKQHFDILLFFVIAIDIFVISVIDDVAFLIITALWIYSCRYYGKTSKHSFAVAIILLLLCPIILFFNLTNVSQKTASWAFMFLLAGTLQILTELDSPTSGRVDR